ncbi:Iron uptake protein [Caballeronia sordidicola]|uniref:Iron uptake protein n=2 Tax=Burkholderiales TaxID=80840 RepID=A0A242MG92_CABSO|nr:Iron uptake protein [Caballeronia sordidicola]
MFIDNYWLVSGTYATVAAPRTLLLSAQIDFQWLQHDNARHCKQMNIVITRFARVGPLVSRIVCAIFGGYALAALTSVATLALPISKPQAVLTGMLASFIVYVCAVIWVFAVRSALRAWTGCLVVALPLLCAAWTVWSGGHV